MVGNEDLYVKLKNSGVKIVDICRKAGISHSLLSWQVKENKVERKTVLSLSETLKSLSKELLALSKDIKK